MQQEHTIFAKLETQNTHQKQQQVSLEITAANMGAANEEGPEFSGPVREKIAGGAATFNDTVVKWQKLLKSEGELAVVEATLRVGTSNSEFFCERELCCD